MKAEYINPFIEASQSVVNMLFGSEIMLGKIYLRKSPFLSDQVVIMIGVIGRIKGQICFELSTDTAKKIASAMMGGMPIAELDEISKSAISEIGNMIMGNASTLLSNKGVDFDITPPVLLMGDNIEVSNKISTIVVPLELAGLGVLSINIAVEEIM